MCQECHSVANLYYLNIDLLFQDLAQSKGALKGKPMQSLSEKEKFFLCLSLQGYEALDIARIELERGMRFSGSLKDRAKNIRKELSSTINEYIKDLINRSDDKIARKELDEKSRMLNWLRVLSFLLQNGYKQSISIQEQVKVEVIYQGHVDLDQIVKIVKETSQKQVVLKH